jgi:hypothetical protein
MRASGISITDALSAAPHEGLAPRQFVWMTVRRRDNGNLVNFGVWNGSVPVTLDVVSGDTGLIVSRLYEPGALKTVEKVRLTTGLRYKPWSFTLDKNHPRIKLALREYDPRMGPVEYHRVPLSMASRRPVAPPRCRFIGIMEVPEFTRPKANGEGGVVISCIGATAELSKPNPAKRSVESTQRRAGDLHSRYAPTCHEWDIKWGE